MGKIWYVIIDGNEEGPYSQQELIEDSRLTQDTLVWKEGFESWVPIRDIPELKEFFEKEIPVEEEEQEKASRDIVPLDEEIVLDFQKEPSYLYLWLIITMVVIIYVFYKLYWWK